MHIIKEANAVLLNLNNPSRVLKLIPTAREMLFKGKKLTVVPHLYQECKVLRNLGIKVPSPILYTYNWVGQHIPYKHQKSTSAFLTMHNRGLVLNEIGTGKTLSALWAADYLMSIGVIRKCLIMSRLSTLDEVWGKTIYTQFLHRKSIVLYGSADKRRKLLKQDADFHIINHEGFSILSKEMMDKYDLIIFDEATAIRNPQTKHAKLFRKWCSLQPKLWLWLMTGTPTPNSPADAWSMADLMGSLAGQTYYSFRDSVMQKAGPWKFVPRSEAPDIVEAALQPSVRFISDECLDLPETIYHTRRVSLSNAQEKHYKEMLTDYSTEIATSGGVISAVNEVVKLMKLVQIACGVAYGVDGSHIEIDCSPRIKAVMEVLEEIGGKALIFTPLVGTLKMLAKKLSTHYTVDTVNGSTSRKKRVEIFQRFQHGDLQILLAHPATMAHGLTLTAASSVIWYGPITSTEQYIQANGRVERIGKHHVTNVIHIESTDLEHKMFNRVMRNKTLQGLLLNLIEQQTRAHI